MKTMTVGVMSVAVLCACSSAEGPRPDELGYDGTGIAVTMGALSYPDATDVCYSFEIRSPVGPVVSRGEMDGPDDNYDANAADGTGDTGDIGSNGNICSTRYGNGPGGAWSYVAPCDGSEGNTSHTVTVWFEGITSGTQTTGILRPEVDYQDPCDGATGCSVTVGCVPNADVPVDFNFTLMRNAQQGFFDVAVNFDDVFCSAKLDTCHTTGEKIRLVFDTAETVTCPWGTGSAYGGLGFLENTADGNGANPDGCNVDGTPFFIQAGGSIPPVNPGVSFPNPNLGERIDTLVAAVACTAGAGVGVETTMTMSRARLICADGTNIEVDLSTLTRQGNHELEGVPFAVTFGNESLPNANKVFTTLAFGIGDRGPCSFGWQVLPTDGPFVPPTSAGYHSLGYVNFEGNGLGGGPTDCDQHGLNDGSEVVGTMYTGVQGVDPRSFTTEIEQSAPTLVRWWPCTNSEGAVAAWSAELDDLEINTNNLLTVLEGTEAPSSEEASAQAAALSARHNALWTAVGGAASCAGLDTSISSLLARLEALADVFEDIYDLLAEDI